MEHSSREGKIKGIILNIKIGDFNDTREERNIWRNEIIEIKNIVEGLSFDWKGFLP
jgi:hypothetical protein